MNKNYTYETAESQLPDLEVFGNRRPAVLMHDEINDRYYRGSTGQTLYPVDKHGSDNPADWLWTDDNGLKYSPNRDYNVEDLIGEQPAIGNQDNTGVQNTDYSYLDEDILDMERDINLQNQLNDIIKLNNNSFGTNLADNVARTVPYASLVYTPLKYGLSLFSDILGNLAEAEYERYRANNFADLNLMPSAILTAGMTGNPYIAGATDGIFLGNSIHDIQDNGLNLNNASLLMLSSLGPVARTYLYMRNIENPFLNKWKYEQYIPDENPTGITTIGDVTFPVYGDNVNTNVGLVNGELKNFYLEDPFMVSWKGWNLHKPLPKNYRIRNEYQLLDWVTSPKYLKSIYDIPEAYNNYRAGLGAIRRAKALDITTVNDLFDRAVAKRLGITTREVREIRNPKDKNQIVYTSGPTLSEQPVLTVIPTHLDGKDAALYCAELKMEYPEYIKECKIAGKIPVTETEYWHIQKKVHSDLTREGYENFGNSRIAEVTRGHRRTNNGLYIPRTQNDTRRNYTKLETGTYDSDVFKNINTSKTGSHVVDTRNLPYELLSDYYKDILEMYANTHKSGKHFRIGERERLILEGRDLFGFSNGGPIVDRALDAYNKINMFKFGV